MKKSKTPIWVYFLLPIIVLSFAATKFIIDFIEKDKLEEELNRIYPRLTKQNHINSQVISTYYPQGWRGASDIQHIKLESGENFTIWIRRNLTDREIYFGDIVKQGSFLMKNAGSDTLILMINNKEYKYLISCNE
ncbi:hypothetical protein [Natronoflexus pectinivorans]|uniref:Uncharacterized protein n=1 Tax=Natronoflexus pectinivorans TaxID=682526 RepID=A0A4R2GP73_9BACT|nr:hypothetical protein [Natronoflexus pectinivorans]TCO10509.1 hypothetical protein EV194_101139 [Natronoflexus pectinivorans]